MPHGNNSHTLLNNCSLLDTHHLVVIAIERQCFTGGREKRVISAATLIKLPLVFLDFSMYNMKLKMS